MKQQTQLKNPTRPWPGSRPGNWFTAHTPNGALVGLATCVGVGGDGGDTGGDDDGGGGAAVCAVDVFMHRSWLGEWCAA